MNFYLNGGNKNSFTSINKSSASSSNSIIPSLIYDELTHNFDNFILLDDDQFLSQELFNIISANENNKDNRDVDQSSNDFNNLICKSFLEDKMIQFYPNGEQDKEGINSFVNLIKNFIVNRLYVTIDNKLITLVQIDKIDDFFQNKELDNNSLLQTLFEHCVERLNNVNKLSTTLPLFVIVYTNDSMEKHEIVVNLIKQIKNKLFINCILKDNDIELKLKKMFIEPHYEKILHDYNQSLQSKQSSFLKTNFSSFLSFGSNSSSQQEQQQKDDMNPQNMSLPEKYELFNKFKKLAILQIIKSSSKNFKESNKALKQCLKEIDDSVILSKYNTMDKVREYHFHLTIMEKYNLFFENKLSISDLYELLNNFPINYELLLYYIPMVEAVCHDGRYTEDFIRIYEFILEKLNNKAKNHSITRGFLRDRISAAYEHKQQFRRLNFNNLLSLKEWQQNELSNEQIKLICVKKYETLCSFYKNDIFKKELQKYTFI